MAFPQIVAWFLVDVTSTFAPELGGDADRCLKEFPRLFRTVFFHSARIPLTVSAWT